MHELAKEDTFFYRKPTLAMFFFILFFVAQPLLAEESKGQLALPSGDLVAPEVVSEPSSQALVPGKAYTIAVKATDNVGVKQVILFYRTIGSGDYKRVLLKNEGESHYSVTLSGDEIADPGIEYYVQTEDLAGNTLLTGYSFSPLVVRAGGTSSGSEDMAALSAGDSLAGAMGDAGASEPLWKNKWLWIGVAAVAGVALSQGGDSPAETTKPSGIKVTACVPNTGTTSC